MKKYRVGACGGTFDYFHKGHQQFLTYCLAQCKKLIIGITTDRYINTQKESSSEQTYIQREEDVRAYIRKSGALERVTFVSLDDLYGPTISPGYPLDVLIATETTVQGAGMVNEKRRQEGLSPLTIVQAPLAKAEDGDIISSSRIRNGEITREGNVFFKTEWFQEQRYLPDNLRQALQEPFGRLLHDVPEKGAREKVISVGDVVTQSLLAKGVHPCIGVVDFLVQRKKVYSNISELGIPEGASVIHFKNSSGTLTPASFLVCKHIFSQRKPVFLQIDGEEDLLVLPILLACPLGYTIFYGQPNKGVIEVLVTEEMKNMAYNHVSNFSLENAQNPH